MKHRTNRRAFLGTAAATALAAPTLAKAQSSEPSSDDFVFEVTRTDEEWRALLTEDQYEIMREVGTEPRFSSDYWQTDEPGHYNCRGCDLTIYDSDKKEVLLIGWVFFHHSRANAVLTSIDEWPPAMSETDELGEPREMIEAHCRRCGSHLGHILLVQDEVLHCINGAALEFIPQSA